MGYEPSYKLVSPMSLQKVPIWAFKALLNRGFGLRPATVLRIGVISVLLRVDIGFGWGYTGLMSGLNRLQNGNGAKC